MKKVTSESEISKETMHKIKRLPTKEQPLNINKSRKEIGLHPIENCDDDIIPIKWFDSILIFLNH